MYESVKARPIYIIEQVYQQRDGRLAGSTQERVSSAPF
jgi:hypothetical protein